MSTGYISHETTVRVASSPYTQQWLEADDFTMVLVTDSFGSRSYTAMPDLQVINVQPYSAPGYTVNLADGQPFINDYFYYLANPDVRAAGMDADTHWATFGYKEGRSAGDSPFDVEFYLQHNQDVAAAGMDPLVHYMTFGASEGRDPSALFDTTAYLAANPDVAANGMNPFLHFLEYGKAEGRDPMGLG